MQTKLRQEKQENWKPAKALLPLMIEAECPEEAELEKLALFEKGLAKELRSGDSLDKTMSKMVKMALAAEFGASFVKSKGCEEMAKSIMQVMSADPQLRRQSLLIIDRFVKK